MLKVGWMNYLKHPNGSNSCDQRSEDLLKVPSCVWGQSPELFVVFFS